MAAGEVPELQKICIFPEGAPYPPYQEEASSGLRLGIIFQKWYFHAGYLRARGVYPLARLDTGTHEVVQADEVMFDQSSPYIQAIAAICDEELADPPTLPEGSSMEARTALLNGYFERTEWIRYVPIEHVKDIRDIDL
jgi:hypothetical protein